MTKDIVETVARAICRAEIKDWPLDEEVTLNMMVDTIWRDWEVLAEAAITAHQTALSTAGYVIVPARHFRNGVGGKTPIHPSLKEQS